MTHFLIAIRDEAAALFAEKHPEISLAHIGMALMGGETQRNATAACSRVVRKSGLRRAIGRGSEAYPKGVNGNRKYDYESIRSLVMLHPEWTYIRCGQELGIPAYAVTVAMEAIGVYRHARRGANKKLPVKEL